MPTYDHEITPSDIGNTSFAVGVVDGERFWKVRVPHLGDLWSRDRDLLARWLRVAAEELDALDAEEPDGDTGEGGAS